MIFYAQINEDGVCEGLQQASKEIQANGIIPVPTYDVSLIGKKWENEEWLEIPQEETEEIEQGTIIQEQTVAIQQKDIEIEILKARIQELRQFDDLHKKINLVEEKVDELGKLAVDMWIGEV